MYSDIINRLVMSPLRSQIKIDFDRKKKIFRLSIPVFSSSTLPDRIKGYVEARKNSTFKPHITSFQIYQSNQVELIQEIPFSTGFQSTLRGQVDEFWQMSKRCKQMLSEIAIEESFEGALHLDSDCQ
jgi:hypothetical protein